jgi:hypothetical protein
MYNQFQHLLPTRDPVTGNPFREPAGGVSWQDYRRIPPRQPMAGSFQRKKTENRRKPLSQAIRSFRKIGMIKAGGTTNQPPRPAAAWRLLFNLQGEKICWTLIFFEKIPLQLKMLFS